MTENDILILENLDTVYSLFSEIIPSRDHSPLSRRFVKGRLLSLCKKGFAESRISDACGRVEYAITDEGQRFLDKQSLM